MLGSWSSELRESTYSGIDVHGSKCYEPTTGLQSLATTDLPFDSPSLSLLSSSRYDSDENDSETALQSLLASPTVECKAPRDRSFEKLPLVPSYVDPWRSFGTEHGDYLSRLPAIAATYLGLQTILTSNKPHQVQCKSVGTSELGNCSFVVYQYVNVIGDNEKLVSGRKFEGRYVIEYQKRGGSVLAFNHVYRQLKTTLETIYLHEQEQERLFQEQEQPQERSVGECDTDESDAASRSGSAATSPSDSPKFCGSPHNTYFTDSESQYVSSVTTTTGISHRVYDRADVPPPHTCKLGAVGYDSAADSGTGIYSKYGDADGAVDDDDEGNVGKLAEKELTARSIGMFMDACDTKSNGGRVTRLQRCGALALTALAGLASTLTSSIVGPVSFTVPGPDTRPDRHAVSSTTLGQELCRAGVPALLCTLSYSGNQEISDAASAACDILDDSSTRSHHHPSGFGNSTHHDGTSPLYNASSSLTDSLAASKEHGGRDFDRTFTLY